MKKLLVLSIIAVAASLTTLGQKAIVSSPVVKKPNKTAPAGFTREKFDPLRDPKADLAAAVITATKSGKRIILDVGGEWCGWCVYMDKFFFQNPALTKVRDDNYVWLKINMSDENENAGFLSAYPAADGYPHLYVLDRDGTLLHSQDTSPLEAGNGYNLAKFTAFLKKWAPKEAPANH